MHERKTQRLSEAIEVYPRFCDRDQKFYFSSRRTLKKNRSTEPAGVVSDSSFRSFFKKSNVIGGIALKEKNTSERGIKQ